ncbi:MAG: hypothetical protein IKX97_00820 [Erysipelotrichaceae bacterium]|nr:hypothetical protein [Erysipelotrichaceae bacterium]
MIRKCMMMLLSIFLLSIGPMMKVYAQEEDAFTVEYAFVMEDESEVPDELLAYLPEKETVVSGTTIHLEEISGIEGYGFLGWDNNDFILEGDTVCTGRWKKIEDKGMPVRFHFVEEGELDGGRLSDKVMALILEEIRVNDLDELKFENYPDTDGYVFVGWEPGVFYEDGSHLYYGVWKKETNTKSIERPDRPADKKITSDGTPVGIPGSGAPHQQLDYTDAYCYEPSVTGYANPGHSYWKISTVSNKAAAIIGMGELNGMPYGAIQAALWN